MIKGYLNIVFRPIYLFNVLIKYFSNWHEHNEWLNETHTGLGRFDRAIFTTIITLKDLQSFYYYFYDNC